MIPISLGRKGQDNWFGSGDGAMIVTNRVASSSPSSLAFVIDDGGLRDRQTHKNFAATAASGKHTFKLNKH